MQFLERDLEDIIFNADKVKLSERGLLIEGVLKRQVKIGNYGISDLVSFRRPEYRSDLKFRPENCSLTVFELKKDIIDEKTFFQALKYLKGLKRYFEVRNFLPSDSIDFNIVLIGREVKGDIDFLPAFSDNIFIFTYEYNVDGIYFKILNNSRLYNEGFINEQRTSLF